METIVAEWVGENEVVMAIGQMTRPRKEAPTMRSYDHPQTDFEGMMRTKTIAHLWLF